MLTATNTTACTRKEPVTRQLSRAAALPTANQMETRFRVMASRTTKPMAANSQKMGSTDMSSPSFFPIIEQNV